MKSLICITIGCKFTVVETYPMGFTPAKRYVHFQHCQRCGTKKQ